MEEIIQYLQIITDVIIIILFIGILISVFYLLKILKITSSKLSDLTAEVKDIKVKLNPAIENFQLLSENLNSVILAVKDNVDLLRGSVNKINSVVDELVEFEKKVQSKIEPPVMETANTIFAVSAGIKTFFESYKNSKDRSLDLENDFEKRFEIPVKSENADNTESGGNIDMELQNVNEKLKDLQN